MSSDSIYMKYPEEATPQRQKADLQLPRAGDRGEWSDCLIGNRASFWGDENVLEAPESNPQTAGRKRILASVLLAHSVKYLKPIPLM